MTTPTPLSPAAQMVLAACGLTACGTLTVDSPFPLVARVFAAAALRAAADQVLPELQEPDCGSCNYMNCDIELYTDHQRKRAAFLAIAAELDGGAK